MSEGTSMKDGPGPGTGQARDAQGAAVILQEARERARRELRVRRPVLFVTWGLVVLVSYGAMWLSVRGQRPYHGPPWEALLLAFLLFVAAAGATANVVDRAASGVGGRSELRRGILALALGVGVAPPEIQEQALWHARAGQAIAALVGDALPLSGARLR